MLAINLLFVTVFCVLLLLILIVFVFIFICSKIRQSRRLKKYDLQAELLQSKLEVQEQSFRHFYELIYENVGQLLSNIKNQLYAVGQKHGKQVQRELAPNQKQLGEAISDLRKIDRTLNAGVVAREGLKAALEKDLDYVCRNRRVHCTIHTGGEAYSLPAEKELIIFRIIQECIGHLVKHPAHTAIQLRLHYAPDKLIINIVTHSSTGLDAISKNNKIHRRAQLIGGTLQIQSSSENGNIHLTIHIRHETANTHTDSPGR